MLNKQGVRTLNLSESELEKFSDLASVWWDPEGELWTLHAINPLRLKFIDGQVNVAEKRVLDVGCGGGLLSEALAFRGADVLGIDLGSQVIQAARLHAMDCGVNVSYEVQAAEALAQAQPASFDVLTCMELIEHVPDPVSLVKACAALVKPGGYLFFSTLNRNFKSFVQAIVAAEYVLNWIPKGTHTYRQFIKPSELGAWGRASGLTLLEVSGIGYRPLSKQFFLKASPDVNYLMSFQKPVQESA